MENFHSLFLRRAEAGMTVSDKFNQSTHWCDPRAYSITHTKHRQLTLIEEDAWRKRGQDGVLPPVQS